MKETNLNEHKLEIKKVEFKCNIYGEWEINETCINFYKPTLCKDCSLSTGKSDLPLPNKI